MRTLHTIAATAEQDGSSIASAYDDAGFRYGRYADGDARGLFAFDGRYAYGDRRTWQIILEKLKALRADGRTRLRVLDLGCGPGLWLRRVVTEARRLGFQHIFARGIDLASGQLARARVASRTLVAMDGVDIAFERGDLRGPVGGKDRYDLCLCLYGVLNHIPVAELPAVFSRMAALTCGHLVATVRSIGSTPTIYVDDISSARQFHQDNRLDRMEVEFPNGRRQRFDSHLFGREELTRLAATYFTVDDLCGIDLFHGRFANDPRWNPTAAVALARFSQELERLEERYSRDAAFIDHATHLALVAHGSKRARD